MPPTPSIPELRRQLIEILTEDLAAVLSALRETLPETADKHAQVIALQARLKDANKERIRNTLSLDEYQRRIDTIRAECLDMINGLEEDDFAPPVAGGNAAAKDSKTRHGSVLYRVPKAMPLRKPSICTIRVAIDEDAILEDIVLDDNVRMRGRVEVSDMMRAELLDPEGEVFSIRPLNDPEQLVRSEGYTQWLFSVTPKVEGEHQLLVKISMMEYNAQLGRYVPRDVSVLETVTIVTEPAALDDLSEAPLKSTGERLALGPSAASPPSTVRRPPSAALRAMAFFFIFLLVGTSASWALTPPPTRDWVVTRYLKDNEQAYQAYIKKWKDQGIPRVEDAYFRKTEINPSLPNLRDYQRAYPEGKDAYRMAVLEKIQTLELKAVESLRAQPDATRILRFVQDFPESERLPELHQAAAGRPDLLLVVEQAYIASIQAQPTATKVAAFLRDFPQSNRLDEVRAAAAARPEVLQTVQPMLEEAQGGRNGQDAGEEVKFISESPLSDLEGMPVPIAVSGKSGLTMVTVPGGTFTMGCQNGRDSDCEIDEYPAHSVTLSGFQIGQYEVTQADWRSVMGSDPPELHFSGCDDCPVERVSWNDIQDFLKKLNAREPGKNYRLPTEAEWEYAARGGPKSKGYLNAGGNDLNKVAWYDGNSGGKTHPVGGKAPNELGLYDMSGNVWEWCSDWYGNYSAEAQSNPKGSQPSLTRVLRGGSWNTGDAVDCRAASRNRNSPASSNHDMGFRLVAFLQ